MSRYDLCNVGISYSIKKCKVLYYVDVTEEKKTFLQFFILYYDLDDERKVEIMQDLKKLSFVSLDCKVWFFALKNMYWDFTLNPFFLAIKDPS